MRYELIIFSLLFVIFCVVSGQDANLEEIEAIVPTTNTTTTTTTTTTRSIAGAGTDCLEASWLAWNDWTECSDSCGSCGYHMRTRTCLTTSVACQCIGDSTQLEYCNIEVCRYPRTTCCNNLKVTSFQGRFACLDGSAAAAAGR